MRHLSIRAAVVGSAFLIAIAHRSALATPDAGALCASAKLVASSCGKTATGDWAVRRWVSTAYTPVRITGLTGKPEPGSDGVQVYVIVDGQIVFTRLVPGDEPEPVHYAVTAPVSIGSTVDFAVSANGSDCGDAVTFVGIIEEVGW